MKAWLKDYRLMLRVLLRDGSRRHVMGRFKLPQSVIMGLCCLPLMVMICTSVASVAPLAVRYSLVVEGVVVLTAAAQGMVLFFALPTLTSALYTAGDTGFVSALPLRTSAVFFARLTKVYIGELAITAYLLLPTLYTFSGAAYAAGGTFSAAFFALVPFIAVVAPILPLAIATLLSLPAMWVASFLKKKALFSTVALIILYMALFAAYFLLIPNLSSVGDIETLSETVVRAFRRVATVLYPDKALASMCLGIDPWVNLGISFGIWAGLVALVFALSAAFYKRAVRVGAESTSSTADKSDKIGKKHSLLSALLIADVKNIFRFPALALSACATVFVTSLIAVFFFISTDAGTNQGENFVPLDEMMQTGILLMLGVMLGGSNYFALMAFTREGKSFYVTRSLPISGKTAVLAKFVLANIANAVSAVLLFVIIAAFDKIHIVNALLIGAVMFTVCAGLNAMSIMFDMRRPYFDWQSLYDVQRQNTRMLAPVLIGFAAGALFIAFAVLAMMFVPTLGETAAFAIYWALCIIVAAVVAGVMCYLLFDRAEELYAAMGERSSDGAVRPTRGGGFLDGGKGGFGGGNRGGMLG